MVTLPKFFPVFPNEVLGYVFGFLSIHDLAKLSLLCRTWRALAIPHLYKFIEISRKSHLASLASLASSDDGLGSVSLTTHTKGFSINNHTRYREDKITKSSLVHLKVVVPRLKKLQFLDWNLPFVPADAKYVELFQNHCPAVERVRLSIPELPFSRSDQYPLFFNFTGLSHADINFEGIHLTSPMAECMLSLTRLLVSSPGLISLTLEDRSLDPISATAIVTSLGGYCVFPQLRVFRICWAGRIESESDNMDWDSFFTPPGHNAHPLRFFFMRHKGIEDLALGWTRESVYEGAIDPDDVARLFPSLKRFEGPAFLCNAITKSDLALNLERLSVVDDTFYGQTQWLKAMTDGLKIMPRLDWLDIRAHTNGDILDPLVLSKFIQAAPALSTLECRLMVEDFYATVLALSQAANLSQLTIDGQTLVASGVSKELQSLTLGDWETTLTCVANYCGKLVAIESADGWMGRKMWEITRDENGNCTNILGEIF